MTRVIAAKPGRLEWIVRRLPPKPDHRAVEVLEKLSRKELAEQCWAAMVNDDMASQSSSEAWARVAELVDMLDGKRKIDKKLLANLRKHRKHVNECRTGSCEHEYAALVRARVHLPRVSSPRRAVGNNSRP